MAGEARIAKQVVMQALVDNAGVAALCEGRVFGAHLRDPDQGEHAYPFVIVTVLSGTPTVGYNFQHLSLEVWCYSRTSLDDATQIYDAVKAALQHQRLTLTGVTMAVITNEAIRPRDGWNEAVSAWYMMGRFTASSVA